MGALISYLWSRPPPEPSLLGSYIEPKRLLMEFDKPADSFLIRPLRRYYEEEEKQRGKEALKLVAGGTATTSKKGAPRSVNRRQRRRPKVK